MLAGDGERLSSFEATTSGGCSVWFLVVIPFLLRNLRELNTTANNQNQDKISFLLSCLFGTLDGSDLMKQNCSSNVSRRIYDRLVGFDSWIHVGLQDSASEAPVRPLWCCIYNFVSARGVA